MKIGKIEAIIENDYDCFKMLYLKTKEEYYGLFIDRKIMEEERKELKELYGELDYFELQNYIVCEENEIEDDKWIFKKTERISFIGQEILNNFAGTLILDKNELIINAKTEIKDYEIFEEYLC